MQVRQSMDRPMQAGGAAVEASGEIEQNNAEEKRK